MILDASTVVTWRKEEFSDQERTVGFGSASGQYNTVFSFLGTGHMFTLLKFLNLYICDLNIFFYACYISIKQRSVYQRRFKNMKTI